MRSVTIKTGLLAGPLALALAACSASAAEDGEAAEVEPTTVEPGEPAPESSGEATFGDPDDAGPANAAIPIPTDEERAMYDALQSFVPEVEGYEWVSEYGAGSEAPYASRRVGSTAEDAAVVSPAECATVLEAFTLKTERDFEDGGDDILVTYGFAAEPGSDLDLDGPRPVSLEIRVMDEASQAAAMVSAALGPAACESHEIEPEWGGRESVYGAQWEAFATDGADSAVVEQVERVELVPPDAGATDDPVVLEGDDLGRRYLVAVDRYVLALGARDLDDLDATVASIVADFVEHMGTAGA